MVKAFVGHSFTADDKNLVLSVTEFLDAFKSANSTFDWMHAESARSEDVVDKVLPMLRQCDVFIGICSRKERVATPSLFRKSRWKKSDSVIEESKLEWKTSDWIIQEIAIAREREMRLILLIEDGVRTPGGLHGNLEYIQFQRENIGGAYVRMTQMLGSILVGVQGTAGIDSKLAPPQKPLTDEQAEQKGDPLLREPDESWQAHDYYVAIFHAIFLENEDYLERVRVAFTASEIGLSDNGLLKWQARKEYSLLVLDKGGSLEILEKLVSQGREDPEIISLHARVLNHFKDQRGAAKLYEEAAQVALAIKDYRIASINLFNAVDLACKLKDEKEVRRLVEILVNFPKDDKEVTETVLRAMELLAKIKNHPLIRIAAMEHQVAIDPTDADKRFSLAYAYSEIDDDFATLMHYLAIPDARRSETVWNNLGVARQALKLPVLAIDAYQIAGRKNNSLAMSNLAQAYIGAGFYSEAQAVCQKGLDFDDPHENLPSTFAQIKATRGEEQKVEDSAVESAEPRSRLMQKFGEGALGKIKSPLSINWTSPQGFLTLSEIDDEIEMRGQYVQSMDGLFGLVNTPPAIYELKIKGTLYGRTAMGTIQRKKQGESSTSGLLALDITAPKPIIFFFSDDCRTIHAIENPGKTFREFFITAVV